MIVDWMLQLLSTVLGPVVSNLPQGNLPAGFTDGALTLGTALHRLDALVPIRGPLFFVLDALVVTFPALLSYKVAMWVWSRVRG